ncbi:hypothetical protein ABZ793_31785 [Micromonospora sp. NPDC047465]|uniref:hypothetical protein n=1 Tax=Micromonospora sp. NPDC047465 TaxID=3154813 RepID=UPI0033D6EAD0
MTIDDLVGRALTEMTEGLRPQPDPYSRVRARLQRSRRRTRAAVGLCMAAVVSATGATVIGPSHGGGPPMIEPEPGWQTMLRWAERLADSPPRGAVGADPAFVADLANRISERQRAGAYRVKAPVRQVKVLFVDDIGSRRIALVAFALAQPDSSTQWPNAHAWFVAPRGASAEVLAAPPDQGEGDGLEPFMSTTVPGDGVDPVEPISVGVAPAGCEFATAPLPEATAWQPEPTGSYIVRTKQTQRPEWWQITCDGVVRVSQPAPGSLISARVTDAQLESAVGTARGTLDREQSRTAISALAGGYGYAIKALPQVIWNGRTAGTEADSNGSFDGRAVVLAAPAVHGGWLGEVQIVYDHADGRSATGTGQSFTTDTDPTDPSSIVAVRLGQNTSTVLVVTPADAATLRAVGRGGEVVARTPVRDAGAVIKVADPAGLTIEALDAKGAVIGRGEIVEQGGRIGSVDRWGER